MSKTQIEYDLRNDIVDFLGRVRVSNVVALDVRQEADHLYQQAKPQRNRKPNPLKNVP